MRKERVGRCKEEGRSNEERVMRTKEQRGRRSNEDGVVVISWRRCQKKERNELNRLIMQFCSISRERKHLERLTAG